MAHPEGYRKALRLMKQAEKFKRPILRLLIRKVHIREKPLKNEGKVNQLRKI